MTTKLQLLRADDMPAEPNEVIIRKTLRQRLCYDSRLDRNVAEDLWADVDGVMSAGTVLKAGNRCTAVRIEHGSQPLVLKRYNLRHPLHTISHSLSRTRACNNWKYGRKLFEAGFATPLPLAFLEQRIGPFKTWSYVLTEFVPGPSLYQVLFEQTPHPQIHDRLLQQFTSIWNRLGELRLSHGDTKTANFIVTGECRLCLIDLDGMRRHRLEITLLRARNRDWDRFMDDWQKAPHVESAFEEHGEGFETRAA